MRTQNKKLKVFLKLYYVLSSKKSDFSIDDFVLSYCTLQNAYWVLGLITVDEYLIDFVHYTTKSIVIRSSKLFVSFAKHPYITM